MPPHRPQLALPPDFGSPELAPLTNAPLSAQKRAALRAAFRDLVSVRPAMFSGALEAKYIDENSYKADLLASGGRHWADSYYEYERAVKNETRRRDVACSKHGKCF